MTRFTKIPPPPLPWVGAVGLPEYAVEAVVALVKLTKSKDARVARSAAKSLARFHAELVRYARRHDAPPPHAMEIPHP